MADPPETTQVVYANWVRTRATPWDIGFDLGYQDVQGGGPPDHIPVRAVMSWEHAKALNELLTRAIASYEEQTDSTIRSFTEVEEGPTDDN